MRFLLNERINGWVMTGLLGDRSKWFFGHTRNSTADRYKEIYLEMYADRVKTLRQLNKSIRRKNKFIKRLRCMSLRREAE